MRLNVGCGEYYADGWVNVDLANDEWRSPDVECSVFDMSPEIDGVTAVYLGHVLEHWDTDSIVTGLSALLARCVAGAPLVVVGPDVPLAERLHAEGRLDARTVANCRVGEGRWPGDDHRWECSGEHVAAYLKEAGLVDVRCVPIESSELNPYPVVSRAPWQFAVIGAVPGRIQ